MSITPSPDLSTTRAEAVRALITTTRARLGGGGLTRDLLDHIRKDVADLAAQTDFWTDPIYAPPEGDERQARYLIGAEEGTGISLYLNVMRSGKKSRRTITPLGPALRPFKAVNTTRFMIAWMMAPPKAMQTLPCVRLSKFAPAPRWR